MKTTTFKASRVVKLTLFLFTSTIIAAYSKDWFVTEQPSLPSNVARKCVNPSGQDDQQLFASWFESGSIKLNGGVKPANSLDFKDNGPCSFYLWAEQMFLWLTSPAPGGGDGRIFNSPVFYGVTNAKDPGDKNSLMFIHHTQKIIADTGVAKRGPNNLPVVLSKQGRFLEVAPQTIDLSGKLNFIDGSGKEVYVDPERTTISKDRKLLLFDKAGKAIHFPSPNAELKAQYSTISTVQKFIFKGETFFVDSSGNIIDIEVGQPKGKEVLMTKNSSLVYYTTAVNDTFAYFLTGVKNGKITPSPSEFPSKPEDLAKIAQFASAHGHTLAYPNTLAVAIKAAWVEVDKLPEPNNAYSYITTEAMIPIYNESPTKWVRTNKKRKARLALIGLHVVGSVLGHPEMIWATFEHFGNTPNAAYAYFNKTGTRIDVPQDTTGNWLFCATCSGDASSSNKARVRETEYGTLVPIGNNTIGPSETLRIHPWGAPGSSASSNTCIVSVNKIVHGILPNGDVRKNYLFVGATWSFDGGPPILGNRSGTNKLANSTMETYQQSLSCFDCHSGSNMLNGLSHIWKRLKPLF